MAQFSRVFFWCVLFILFYRKKKIWLPSIQRSLLLISPDLTRSSFLSPSSRPSAQRPASWPCASAAWRSPTKISRNPRKTSCTRSRRERRRGFTSKNRHTHTHPYRRLIYCYVRRQREFWYILCMLFLVYPPHSLVTIICERRQIKENKNSLLSAVPNNA